MDTSCLLQLSAVYQLEVLNIRPQLLSGEKFFCVCFCSFTHNNPIYLLNQFLSCLSLKWHLQGFENGVILL